MDLQLDELQTSVQEVMRKIESLRSLYVEGKIEKERKKLVRLTQLKNQVKNQVTTSPIPSSSSSSSSSQQEFQEDRKSLIVPEELVRRKDDFNTRSAELDNRGPHTPPRKRDREESEESRKRHKRSHHSHSPGGEIKREEEEDEPSVDCSIFVSDIPRRVTEEELKQAFSEVGPVYEATVVTQKKNGISKGFGFVRFFGMEDVKKALEMQAPEFQDERGRRQQVKIRLADPKNALQITNFPKEWTLEQIEEEIKRRGEVAVERIEMKNHGEVFVSFKDHDTALGVMRTLQGVTLSNIPLSINLTESQNRQRRDQAARTLFVKGVASTISEVELAGVFGVEVIERVRIPTDKESGQPLGHAFVHFKTREDAEDAMTRFENYELHGRRFHLDWSMEAKSRPKFFADSDRPNLRGRSMHYQRRDDHYHEDDRRERYDRGGY